MFTKYYAFLMWKFFTLILFLPLECLISINSWDAKNDVGILTFGWVFKRSFKSCLSSMEITTYLKRWKIMFKYGLSNILNNTANVTISTFKLSTTCREDNPDTTFQRLLFSFLTCNSVHLKCFAFETFTTAVFKHRGTLTLLRAHTKAEIRKIKSIL